MVKISKPVNDDLAQIVPFLKDRKQDIEGNPYLVPNIVSWLVYPNRFDHDGIESNNKNLPYEIVVSIN